MDTALAIIEQSILPVGFAAELEPASDFARASKAKAGRSCGYYGARRGWADECQRERGSQASTAVRLMFKREFLKRIWLTSSLDYRRR